MADEVRFQLDSWNNGDCRMLVLSDGRAFIFGYGYITDVPKNTVFGDLRVAWEAGLREELIFTESVASGGTPSGAPHWASNFRSFGDGVVTQKGLELLAGVPRREVREVSPGLWDISL